MATYPQSQRTEALTLLFGIVPWSITPALAEVTKLLWPDNLPVFALLVVVSFASAIAAIKVGRTQGGSRSQKATVRWGYWLGCGFVGVWVCVIVIAGPFAVWLFLWPK